LGRKLESLLRLVYIYNMSSLIFLTNKLLIQKIVLSLSDIFNSLFRFMDLKQQWLVYANKQFSASQLLLNYYYPFLCQCFVLKFNHVLLLVVWLLIHNCISNLSELMIILLR
jgi:hypothetical protein